MITRRQFAALALSGLSLRQSPANRPVRDIAGVRIGAQTYSFRALSRPPGGDLVDVLIGALRACGLVECELWSPQIEPAAPSLPRGNTPEIQEARQQARAALRRWRV